MLHYTLQSYIQSVYFRVFRIQNGRQKLFYVYTYEQFSFLTNQGRLTNILDATVWCCNAVS